MRSLDIDAMRRELQAAGIAPRHIRRTINELADHYADLVDAASADGADSLEAHRRAIGKLGNARDIAALMRAQPELRSWAFRFPRIALVVYPLSFLVLAPVAAGVEHAPGVTRWGACLVLGGFVTAAMFLVLQLSITLT